MDILWLQIGIIFGVDLIRGTYSTDASMLPIAKDFNDHGTQYRFQYFVRDERGDYKTQEEAGEGGVARGSYAVAESDGDLRIVQYTADLGGGFKAHIKVNHGGKTAAKLQEIDIPAEEMRKLIDDTRKKEAPAAKDDPEIDKSSKSYVLGPPRKMSDIVMEQAAAIREIISKEMEAEEKREAEESRLRSKNGEKNIESRSEGSKSVEKDAEISAQSSISNSGDNRTAKGVKIEGEKSTPNGETPRDSRISSPVVRVALRPRNIDDIKKIADAENAGLSKAEGFGGPAVRNFSFKNRITFYKPADKKSIQNTGEIKSEGNFKRVSPQLKSVVRNADGNLEPADAEQEEIVLYSPYTDHQDEVGEQGDRKSRFITVPYEVLRPYLKGLIEEEEISK